nr:NBS-containing resistance-like protein [Tanacetum cinerariifolium]
MAASAIPILSDSSEESVGSHVPRVILFGIIPVIIPVIYVIPVEVPIVPVDPLVVPKRPERHESLVVHDAMVLRWKDRVASRPSSSSGSSSHDTLAPLSKVSITKSEEHLLQRQNIVVLPMLLLRLVGCGIFSYQRTKHIEIDIHFARDLVAAGFTKGLPLALSKEFRFSLSV